MSNIVKRGAQSQPTKTPQVEGEKYTVLLLDEDQLDRFLKRPRLERLTSQLSRTVDVWPRGQRARIWATATAVVVLAVTIVWLRDAGDAKAAASRPAPPRIVNGPPMATGASFSVNVTSFSRDADARIMAGRLTKEGLPSFAWRLNGGLRDVLVGPFVSIDEAEAAQRSVARLGYNRSRLHVDERLRSTDAAVASAKASPAVVLVAAPGRLAVAFELSEEPQQVSGRRIDSTTFAVTASAGPVIQAQEWNAPSDVQLVKHVSVAADPRGLQGLDARVTVAENTVATMRLQGTRVYVDVSRAQLDFDEQPAHVPPVQRAAEPVAPARAAGPVVQPRPARSAVPATATSGTVPAAPSAIGPRAAAGSPANEAQYRQAIGPVFARFEEIQPFLRSAVSTPTPEVLAAISGTFAELEQTLQVTDVPRSSQGAHGLLLSAVQLARGAVAPSFSGDRMTQVREAMAQFRAAKAQLR